LEIDLGAALGVYIDRVTQELRLGGVILPKHDILILSMDSGDGRMVANLIIGKREPRG
jgi:hypothetical protein